MCLIQQVVTISTTKSLFHCLANSMKISLLCFAIALKTLSSSTGKATYLTFLPLSFSKGK